MELIERAIAKYGTVAAVAKKLGVTPGFVSQLRTGHRSIPPLQAGRLGEMLELNPLETIVKTMEEQAVKKDERRAWQTWLKLVAHTAVAAFAAVGLSGIYPSQADASQPGGAKEKGPGNEGPYIQCVQHNGGVWGRFAAWLRGQWAKNSGLIVARSERIACPA